jgi:DNA/RNA-binding domain of Phe-tRNA-synthetase-like protein
VQARIASDPHPLLDPGCSVFEAGGPLGGSPSPPWLVELLGAGARSPFEAPDERVRAAVRDLLRHGGFKPTGRSKPSSEYLARTAADGGLPSINLAVDLCNAVSLHSGLPISVVDLDRAQAPLRIGIAAAGSRFVFNRSGQEIEVGGLVGLADAAGPCANPVKDAQRTKTDGGTRRALFVVWGTRSLPGRTAAALAWLEELAARAREPR